MSRFFTPLFFIFIGIIFLIQSIRLPKAPVGDPNELRYFPILLSILLIFFSVLYLFNEFQKRTETFKAFSQIIVGKTPVLLIVTIIMMLIYTNIFNRLGFLISTTLFLGGLLFLLNGKTKWLSNILVAVIFTVIAWYSFGVLLQVNLP